MSKKKTKKPIKPGRGRKPKKGRAIISFTAEMFPTEYQEDFLHLDMQLFREFYKYTTSRLSEDNGPKKMYKYDKDTGKPVYLINSKNTYSYQHSRRYIMGQQANIMDKKENVWMRSATNQVLFRAVIAAFDDFHKEDKKFDNDNIYEGKIKYGLSDGHLELKKFGQKIQLADVEIPKGSLEKVVIQKTEDGRWIAEISVLEPFSKVESIIEDPDGSMPVDSLWRQVNTNNSQKKTLNQIARDFEVIREKSCAISFMGSSIKDTSITMAWKIHMENDLNKYKYLHHTILNSALIAGHSRANRYKISNLDMETKKAIREGRGPKVNPNEIMMTSGFLIKNGILHIPKLGLHMIAPKLKYRAKYVQYLILKRDNTTGEWGVQYKYKRKTVQMFMKDIIDLTAKIKYF